MAKIASVDPSVAVPYVALFVGGQLQQISNFLPAQIDAFAIEVPAITGQSAGKDPQDVLDLARAAERYLQVVRHSNPGCDTVEYAVNTWKGNTAKPLYWRNMWRVLSDDEKQAVVRSRDRWNYDVANVKPPYYWLNAKPFTVRSNPIPVLAAIEMLIHKWHAMYAENPKKVQNYGRFSNFMDAIGIGLFAQQRVDTMGRGIQV